jgi:hypothetical protein
MRVMRRIYHEFSNVISFDISNTHILQRISNGLSEVIKKDRHTVAREERTIRQTIVDKTLKRNLKMDLI